MSKISRLSLLGQVLAWGLPQRKLRLKKAQRKVTLVARRQDLERAVAEIGQGARAIVADIEDEQAIQSLFAQVETVAHLVTAAADLTFSPIDGFDSDAAKHVVSSKILGPFYGVKYAIPRLSKNGSITFFSGFSA